MSSDENFILQQGLAAPPAASRVALRSALLFQPRLVGLWTLGATLLQSATAFLTLAAVLWWNALAPRWNPFDALYNRFLAGRDGPRLSPAPAPRRFAQGMAGTFAASIGLCLLAGAPRAAFVIETLFLVFIGLLVFARFCLGSFVFYMLSGRTSFALQTLPWRRSR